MHFCALFDSDKEAFFAAWTFNSPEAYNTFYSLYFCSIVGLSGSIVVFWKEHWFWSEPILVSIIGFLITFGQFNPIDTPTFPRDLETFQEENSIKKVLVEYENCKTNSVYQDTLYVEDLWVFRKVQ